MQGTIGVQLGSYLCSCSNLIGYTERMGDGMKRPEREQ